MNKYVKLNAANTCIEVYYCLKPVLSKKYNVSYKDIFSSYIKKTNNLR